ncbi:hypothetical protein FOA52_003848 [Chlamydomonas sp. UWO 241]|nr:hypothetical protein FOA52_003848 [Chlamydomonas sp. UWO 241]
MVLSNGGSTCVAVLLCLTTLLAATATADSRLLWRGRGLLTSGGTNAAAASALPSVPRPPPAASVPYPPAYAAAPAAARRPPPPYPAHPPPPPETMAAPPLQPGEAGIPEPPAPPPPKPYGMGTILVSSGWFHNPELNCSQGPSSKLNGLISAILDRLQLSDQIGTPPMCFDGEDGATYSTTDVAFDNQGAIETLTNALVDGEAAALAEDLQLRCGYATVQMWDMNRRHVTAFVCDPGAWHHSYTMRYPPGRSSLVETPELCCRDSMRRRSLIAREPVDAVPELPVFQEAMDAGPDDGGVYGAYDVYGDYDGGDEGENMYDAYDADTGASEGQGEIGAQGRAGGGRRALREALGNARMEMYL